MADRAMNLLGDAAEAASLGTFLVMVALVARLLGA
jgi:hypothetical protein